jgi:hypothetical protein
MQVNYYFTDPENCIPMTVTRARTVKKIFLLLGFVFTLVGFFPFVSVAQYTLNLNGPLYGQNTWFYCGAASAQMIMQNYPNPTDNACFGQAHIYNRIQVHKQDHGYYSDPEGLRGTIMELNSPPAGGRFSIFHDTDRDQVMHSMLYWMAEREYSSATLINSGDHWVVVTGFETDVDPRSGNATLQTIDINDPLPQDFAPHDDPCTAADEGNEGGLVRLVTGSSWYTNDWSAPSRWGTDYLNEYVAVVEPPKVRGKVTAELQALSGQIISSEDAIKRALQQIRQRKLHKKKAFSFLQETKPQRALLTNRKKGGYYLVLFELENRQLSAGAVLVNAYTGEFQEIGAFPEPLEYLTAKEAKEIGIASVRAKPDRPASAELVFKSAQQIRSRYRPIWRVIMEIDDRRVVRYVDHLGQVFVELTPLPLGGD